MKKRLVQLLGDLTEELWYFPLEIKDEDIQMFYKMYEEQEDIDMFEEYMEENHPDIDCERVFVDEIYI